MPSYSTVMEKGHYGNAAPDHSSEDVNSGFPLDFAGMFDAADSGLHQQIYEYLQGPPVHQSDHHQFLSSTSSQDQGPGFPGPAQLYSGPPTSFPAVSLYHQATMPGAPLRGQANFGEQRSAPDTSLSHLSRCDGAFDYRRKESIKAGSSAMGVPMLPTGVLRSCSALPAQMYSTDMFNPPAQPNLVYNAREFSGYEASCSPNGHLKRAPGGEADLISSHEPRSRGRKAQKTEPAGHEISKSQRPVEQAEHIIRERQRRDDMTSKFLMLESLLPPGPKRDRSTVVEDSIQYVKSLHHRVKALHEKRSVMKSNTISFQTTSDPLKQKRKPTTLLNSDIQKQVNASAGHKKEVLNPAPSPSESNYALVKSGSIEKVEVHLDLPHQIVIQMTCRPHRHIQSQIMAALERLGMDVSRCSISKSHNCLICVLVVKPRVMTEPLITGDDVIGALKRAIVLG